MLISTADVATSKIILTQKYHNNTSFQLVGSGADIIFEGPDADFDLSDPDSYAGGWTPLVYDGVAVILDANTNCITIYGAVVIRVSKTAADGAGVLWKW